MYSNRNRFNSWGLAFGDEVPLICLRVDADADANDAPPRIDCSITLAVVVVDVCEFLLLFGF